MRSLPLFSGKPRGKRTSPEASLQIVVCEHLRLRGREGLLYFHPCNEGKRTAAHGMRLLRMGMLPGIADLVVIIPARPILFLELKARGGKQSPEQIAFMHRCLQCGHAYGLADNIDDALKVLAEAGAFQQRRAQGRRDEERRERRAA